MGHCIHRQIIMVIKMNNFNHVNDSNIACQIQMRLFGIILYLINVASSTPLATMKLHAVSAAFNYAILCTQPGQVLGQTFWKWNFDFVTRHLTANLQSGGKFAKSCETTRLQFSAGCCSHGSAILHTESMSSAELVLYLVLVKSM